MGAFCLSVYASEGNDYCYEYVKPTTTASGPMMVSATWLDDEMLRVDVTDIATGAVSSLALRLGDFIADADNNPYILIQAADVDGNLSGTIKISNPFYVPESDVYTAEDPPSDYGDYEITTTNGVDSNDSIVSAVPPPSLTPDGTGTVVDNVLTQNEIEFFTVYTEEGNVFFLVIDRQSSTDNVYLLNTVTEADLMALAERSGNPIEDPSLSAIPTPPIPEPEQPAEVYQQPEPTPEPETQQTPGASNNSRIIVLVAVAAIGGAAYYLKIVKPKKDAGFDDDYEDEDDEEDNFDDELELYDGGDE